MKKQTVINFLNKVPKHFLSEEFIERLVFMEKIKKGLAQTKSGKTTGHCKIIERFGLSSAKKKIFDARRLKPQAETR